MFPDFVYRLRFVRYTAWDEAGDIVQRVVYADDASGKRFAAQTIVHHGYLYPDSACAAAREYMLRQVRDLGETLKEKDSANLRRRPARV